MTTASLAWYPAAGPLWEALWADVRARIGVGPSRLDWPDDFDAHWRDPGLVMAQTCALPYHMRLHGHLHVVGAFDFGLDGAPPGTYRSHLVTRIDDDRPLRDAARGGVALNAVDSQSGWGALHATGLPIGPASVTGSHAASMEAVAAGRADLAAIDAVTWRLSPHPRLAVRATTPPTPGCPLVTSRADLVDPLRGALRAAIPDLPLALRRRAGLRGFVVSGNADYLRGATPPPPTGRAAVADGA